MYNNKYNWILLLCLLGLQSCVKEIDEYKASDGTAVVTDMMQLKIPASFDYELRKDFNLNISTLTSNDLPISGVKIRIMTDIPENNGEVLYTGFTKANGKLIHTFKLSRNLKEVIINTDFIGLPNNAKVNAQGGSISLTLGGSNPQTLVFAEPKYKEFDINSSSYRVLAVPPKVYLGTWAPTGLPNYLSTPRDAVSSAFLNRINQSLPENLSVTAKNPQYISSNVNTAISVNQTADLWMTFVHEGVTRKNTIGYYKYHKNNPPLTTSAIAKLNIVFPNFSYLNSGGGLISGDKVYLGKCGVDTMIGFVLLTNAYNSTTRLVGNGTLQFYSNSILNPETKTSYKTHNVLLWDPIEEKMVVGFEDMKRSAANVDDFNDNVFYIKSFPSNALSTSQINTINLLGDTDGDGVQDNMDEYPFDANMAFNTYYPGSSTLGYLAFEDLWPYSGDYDLNDLIVGYLFNSIQNGNNETSRITAKIFVKASGGSYQNGFGIELPFPPALIKSVTGSRLTENYISLSANGTEAGQAKAVIIAFDNSRNLAAQPVGYYVNTQPESPVVISDTITLVIDFNSPIPMSTLGSAPFNPFLIINKDRGKEIHMVNKPPTSLADVSIFNTGKDRSNPAAGIYYKSDINLPWCLNIPDNYRIVVEKSQIINAYFKFSSWVQSGGASYPDWYQNSPGYIDPNKIIIR